MSDASLATLLDEVRGKTLWLVNVSPQDARWTPPGTNNHILWHAGHIFCMVERLVTGALLSTMAIPQQIPEGWWELFGWDSRPGETPAERWPELEEVVDLLRRQHGRLRDALSELTEAQLSASLQLPGSGWDGAPVRRLILHAFHDEACHGGEIWLLRKLRMSEATR